MVTTTASRATTPARYALPGLVLLGLLVSLLFYYKWGASLRTLGTVRTSGKLPTSPSILLDGGVFATTLAYFGKIWPALTYGILIGAAVRAAIPAAWVARWLGARGPRPLLTGALAGAPLMLCSCCVTPIFTGLHQRGARLGPALAVMLASPGLNLAALVLTFSLLPARVAVARVAAVLLIVLGLSTLIGKTMEARNPEALARFREVYEEHVSLRQLLPRFAKSVLYLVAITAPLIVAGVLLSGLLLPHVTQLTGASRVVAVGIVALVGTLAALPTFLEIPIAILLLSLGAPAPVVVAFVVAGPVVNLPSLLVVGREAGPRVALALGAGVWAVATAAGLVTTI